MIRTSRVRSVVVLSAAVMYTLALAGAALAQGRPDLFPGAGPTVLDGELETSYEDFETSTRLVHFLHTDNRRIPVEFADGSAPDLMTGTRIRVRGNLADGSLTTTSTGVSVLAGSPSRTLGQQDVLVILFNFANDLRQPWTRATIGDINGQVRSYYLENTFGQMTMSFTVAGWYTIPSINSGCSYYTWASQAETLAANAGINLAAYDRLVFAFPTASGCGWTGMGNVGGPRSWINGSYVLRTVAHEQGHNFGDRHSRARKCDTAACTTVEYGDDRDVMGGPRIVGHMNAFQKERLGWLNYGSAPIVQTVSATGEYWVDGYEAALGNTKALKIWNPVANGYYYVELRNRIGFDGTVPPGVTVHSAIAGYSYQLDFDPVTTAFDSTLDVGQIFSDPAMGLRIETLSVSSGGAAIRVTLSPPPCATAAPALSLLASNAFKYAVTITNKNSSMCAASTFKLSAAVPTGWSAAFSSSLLTLAPGSSASATLTVAPPAATSGTYSFTVTAADMGTNGKGASTGATVTLVSNLAVTASASVSIVNGVRVASINVGAKAGTQAALGATLAIVVTGPTGVKTTLYATTGTSGTATAKMSLKSTDPGGAYQVQVTASGNGGTGYATTSFVAP